MNKQSGFTLIELVMVIVILGVLAVTALPKFVDLKSDSQSAALTGVAGSLTSAFAINYAARSANSTKGVAVANCNDAANVLQGGLPTGYSVNNVATAAGASTTCQLTQTATTNTASYTAIGIN